MTRQVSFVVAVGLALVLGVGGVVVAATVVGQRAVNVLRSKPGRTPSPVPDLNVNLHGAVVEFVWTAGGRPKSHPYYFETAWVQITKGDVDLTVFLTDEQVQQFRAIAMSGPCPDVCPKVAR